MRRAALAALGAWLALAPPGAAGAVELEGTWYLLVHYQDPESGRPDAWRWDERVWRFARDGERLVWTEWPLVVFDDDRGRFERLGRREARVVAAWEPSKAQLADIRDGLQVNSRGVKTKTLLPADGGAAWRSGAGAGPESASVITYSETWSIEGLPDAPVFARDDALGGGGTESVEGTTRYATLEVRDGGRELAGSFERDGTRSGRFRLIRSGETEAVRSAARTQEERQRKATLEAARQAGLVSEAEVHAMVARGIELDVPAGAEPDAVRASIRRSVEDAYRRQGEDPSGFAAQVDSLAGRIAARILDEGQSVADVQRAIEAGELTP